MCPLTCRVVFLKKKKKKKKKKKNVMPFKQYILTTYMPNSNYVLFVIIYVTIINKPFIHMLYVLPIT